MKTRTYMYKTAVYGSPIKAAILKTEKGLNVVLRPRCSFDLQATFLQISVCVCQCVCMSFCPVLSLFTHILHTHTHPHMQKYTRVGDGSSFLSQTVCLPCIRTDLSYIARVYDDKSYI